MAWTLKAILPDDASFSGQIVWNSTEIEIPTTFKEYVESVDHSIKSQFINKYTGFETKKYNIRDTSEHHFNFMLVGDLPRWLRDLLHVLAIATNGAGMIIRLDDTWVTTEGSTLFDCRWVNAGDFVDNSELLNGATMNLVTYQSTLAITVDIFQKVIEDPGLQWQLQINEVGADNVYYRIA